MLDQRVDLDSASAAPDTQAGTQDAFKLRVPRLTGRHEEEADDTQDICHAQ